MSVGKKDFLYSNLFQYVTLAFQFVFITLFIKVFGDSEYGILSVAISVCQLSLVLFDFGLSVSLLKFKGDEKTFRKMNFIFNAWQILGMCVLSALFVAYYYGGDSTTVLLTLFAVFSGWISFSSLYWQWKERYPKYLFVTAAFGLAKVLLVTSLFFVETLRPHGYALLTLTSAMFFGLLIYKIWTPIFSQPLKGLKKLREGIDFHLWRSQAALYLYTRSDIVMLSWLSVPLAEIGLYGYCYSFFSACLLLPSTTQNLLLRSLFSKKMEGATLWKKANKLYFAIGVVLCLGFAYILPWVFQVLGFIDPKLTLYASILAPAIAIIYLTNLLGIGLLTADQQKGRSRAHIVAALTNVTLNILLIPSYGAAGAALATTLSYFVVYLLFLGISLKKNVWNLRSSLVELFFFSLLFLGLTWYFSIAPLVKLNSF